MALVVQLNTKSVLQRKPTFGTGTQRDGGFSRLCSKEVHANTVVLVVIAGSGNFAATV